MTEVKGPPLDPNLTLRDEKARLRTEVLARRDGLSDREGRSARIHARVLAHPAWEEAAMVSCFVGVKSEVATLPLIEAAFQAGKRVAVPVVEGAILVVYRIESPDELAPAPFGLLEPRKELRRKARRLVATQVRLWLVPGVAFDRNGGRVGYGKGYYDALLSRVKPEVWRIGLAFETQMMPRVPMGPTDQRLSMIITEDQEYLCVRPTSRRPPT